MGIGVDSRLLVIDSWPVLEWLKGRAPAARKFEGIVSASRLGVTTLAMSRINSGEVIYTIRKAPEFLDPQAPLQNFLALPITLYSVDDALIDDAVELKAKYALAYADAFAAALAMRLDVPVVTGDKEYLNLERDGLIDLVWVGS